MFTKGLLVYCGLPALIIAELSTGAVLSTGASTGMFVFGGLVLLLVGVGATASLLGINIHKNN